MTAPTKVDGRKVADESVVLEKTVPAFEKWARPALGKMPFAFFPQVKEQPQFFTWMLGTLFAMFTAILAACTWVFVARSRRTAREAREWLLFGKPTRHFGYGRYRLGHFGTAWFAFTYRLPDVRYRLPEMPYKLPPFGLRLPER